MCPQSRGKASTGRQHGYSIQPRKGPKTRPQVSIVPSMCPRQRTNEKPATANNEKASHETTAPRSRATTARKVQVNGLSRLCNHMGSITILHLCTNRSQPSLNQCILGLRGQVLRARGPRCAPAARRVGPVRPRRGLHSVDRGFWKGDGQRLRRVTL